MLPGAKTVPCFKPVYACCQRQPCNPLAQHATPCTPQYLHYSQLKRPLKRASRSCGCQCPGCRDSSDRSAAAMSGAQPDLQPSLHTNAQVVIVTTVGCQFCKRAKDTLQQAGVMYEEIEASNQLQLLNKIKETTGRRTVPQVIFNSQADHPSQHTSLLCWQRSACLYRSFWEAIYWVDQMTCLS